MKRVHSITEHPVYKLALAHSLFFQTVFPGSSIMFDISLVYILTSFLAVLLNNVLIETFSLDFRNDILRAPTDKMPQKFASLANLI
jgi:hypothetical protein